MNADQLEIYRPEDCHPAQELDLIAEMLEPVGAKVLELGCGRALMTRRLVETFSPAVVIATEVDQIQHRKNRLIDDLPQVRFVYGGAEQIDLEDDSIDLVFMFKSLHHVPMEQMDRAMDEIARVLRPGGLAYLSEPVYAGDFNAILRLFHDEKQQREAAFAAVVDAVRRGRLEARRQVFFLSSSRFSDFSEFEQRILGATHTNHQLDEAVYAQVQEAFRAHMTPEGALFASPTRIDLLAKPEI